MVANPLLCWKSGVAGMLNDRLIQRIASIDKAREFLSMWTDWGVEDCGVTVHSLGVTYLTLMGRELGYCAASELPAPRRGQYGHVFADVRSDSVWFHQGNREVVLLAEFERYTGQRKDLKPKVENLLLAQLRWEAPNSTLIMAYWTEGLVSLPDHGELRSVVSSGFTTSVREEVAGGNSGTIQFLQFVMTKGRDGLLRLTGIVVRGNG